MRLSFTTFASLALLRPTMGFAPRPTTTTTKITTSTQLQEKLTAADILARARPKAVEEAKEEIEAEAEKPVFLFEENVLEDIQNALLTLEKRVKEGPGSLSSEEVQDLESRTGRILQDMEQHLSKGTYVKPPSPFATDDTKGTSTASVTSDAAAAAPATPPPPSPQVESSEPIEYAETSDEEGAAYAGEGGLGLATGTRNTWAIPGMEEMSPEEYRKALQDSVIARQEERRVNRQNLVGNRSALQYLDHLGYGGASDNWKTKDENKPAGDGGVKKSSLKDSSKLKRMSTTPTPRSAPPPEAAAAAASSSPTSEEVALPSDSFDSFSYGNVPNDSFKSTAAPVSDSSIYEQPSHSETHRLVDKVVGPSSSSSDAVEYAETSDEEGAAYAGEGGLGLATGTRNTWAIPGMEKMTPEEYRKALQDSVIARQEERRKNRQNLVGNRSALQYLDQLGYGGASDNWKAKDEDNN